MARTPPAAAGGRGGDVAWAAAVRVRERQFCRGALSAVVAGDGDRVGRIVGSGVLGGRDDDVDGEATDGGGIPEGGGDISSARHGAGPIALIVHSSARVDRRREYEQGVIVLQVRRSGEAM